MKRYGTTIFRETIVAEGRNSKRRVRHHGVPEDSSVGAAEGEALLLTPKMSLKLKILEAFG